MAFWDVLHSPVAIAGFSATILAQLVKVPVDRIRNGSWNWSLLANAGGLPSSHSALMTAMSTSIGFYYGWGSPLFALSMAVTTIVVYDATGVRRESGRQAERINLIVKEIFEKQKWPEEELKNLKEVIGHSPGEALAGVLFGFAVAMLVLLLMPPG